jgi:hypothetical protein
MQRLQIIGGAVCVFGALVAYRLEQGFMITFMFGFIGAVLLIIGILGDKP